MTLREEQSLFAKLIPRLLDEIYINGYEATLGDAWSKLEYKAHRQNSCHYLRLAIDINLFKNGAYLTGSEAHKPFGIFWEGLHPLCRWGGRFKDRDGMPAPDGNHYSMEYENKK